MTMCVHVKMKILFILSGGGPFFAQYPTHLPASTGALSTDIIENRLVLSMGVEIGEEKLRTFFLGHSVDLIVGCHNNYHGSEHILGEIHKIW